ncbi:hypothetical protein FRC04_011500 [Tulasnella sp. 424]|nr:hypothetical protein FRC04_011500 [Tulasnella sp. 424]KAG8971710.1 hypothetical protein FRC05_010876 [Tulasnella sp. 425]
MAQAQRQPLGELPLSRYLPVEAESSNKFKKAASLSPAGILSPPKRRILAAEGLLSPSSSSKSPARRLLFASAADTPRSGGGSSVMSQLAADMVQVAMASTPQHHSSSSSASSSNYSSVSSSSSSSLVSSPTTSSRSASKLSVDATANPSTPQFSRTRPRPLAPSPEIVDSPMSFADDGPVTRPASLKRLRSTDSSSSTGGLAVSGGAPSPTKSPTPKRRNLARATSPSPVPYGSSTAAALAAEAEDLFETELEDKENVPPPRRKKPVSSSGGGFKAPLPPTSTRTGLGLRDMSATPRAVKTREPTYGTYLSPADIRTRRMAMEAEVDMPDSDENMQF